MYVNIYIWAKLELGTGGRGILNRVLRQLRDAFVGVQNLRVQSRSPRYFAHHGKEIDRWHGHRPWWTKYFLSIPYSNQCGIDKTYLVHYILNGPYRCIEQAYRFHYPLLEHEQVRQDRSGLNFPPIYSQHGDKMVLLSISEKLPVCYFGWCSNYVS